MRNLTATLALAMSCIIPIASSDALAATFDESGQPVPPARTAPRSIETRRLGPQVPSAPLPVSRADLERYSALETRSPGAKDYRGGVFVVVFGASTLAVVLLVLLILILV
jgi:hypothetical protein